MSAWMWAPGEYFSSLYNGIKISFFLFLNCKTWFYPNDSEEHFCIFFLLSKCIYVWLLFFHYYQRHVAELVIASISDHSFGSWGLICNKKSRHGNDFSFYAEMAVRTYVRAHCTSRVNQNEFCCCFGLSHRSFLWSNSVHKWRKHFLECWENESLWHKSSKGHKTGNDQVYQTLLDLFNTVYNGLFVLDRATFSGCPGEGENTPFKSQHEHLRRLQ